VTRACNQAPEVNLLLDSTAHLVVHALMSCECGLVENRRHMWLLLLG